MFIDCFKHQFRTNRNTIWIYEPISKINRCDKNAFLFKSIVPMFLTIHHFRRLKYIKNLNKPKEIVVIYIKIIIFSISTIFINRYYLEFGKLIVSKQLNKTILIDVYALHNIIFYLCCKLSLNSKQLLTNNKLFSI